VSALEKIPNLKLVPADSVHFHERPERNRTLRLVERLREEKRLRNPPIVARLDREEYVLLDGANRVSAMKELGYSLVPVQIIEYGDPEVRLKGWHHLLVEGKKLNLRSVYAGLDSVDVVEVPSGALTPLLELRRAFSVFVDETTKCWGIFPRSGRIELRSWMSVLSQVVASYEGKTRLERIKISEFAELPEVFRSLEHELLLFPTISKVELLQLVQEGVMIPTGLTRHLIPGRALGLNLDLALLEERISDESKVARFQELIDDLELRGRIRFYEESAFIMNE
jgi:hypothetical protein